MRGHASLSLQVERDSRLIKYPTYYANLTRTPTTLDSNRSLPSRHSYTCPEYTSEIRSAIFDRMILYLWQYTSPPAMTPITGLHLIDHLETSPNVLMLKRLLIVRRPSFDTHRRFDMPLPQIRHTPITGCRSGVYRSLALAFVAPRVRIDRRVMVLPATHAFHVLHKARPRGLPPFEQSGLLHPPDQVYASCLGY